MQVCLFGKFTVLVLCVVFHLGSDKVAAQPELCLKSENTDDKNMLRQNTLILPHSCNMAFLSMMID